MGYKAAVQVLKKADDLKAKVLRKCDLLNDNEAWTDQQQLQTIYHQVLVLDLEYALDKKVEQELWTVGFKNHISTLQELARDKKNPKRSDCQALLSWCLEAASGFYLSLLQELCTTFDLNFPFRKQGSIYGVIKTTNGEQISFPQSSSCLYICQYCLVHLGDIARYRNQRQQAESFYKQAIMVSPTSGHPYNQLALLEVNQGDRFSTVFYYIRGIAVKNPFPASTTNLLNTLNSVMDKESPIIKVQTKMSVNEFLQLFLCLHGFLHTTTELDQAEIGVKSINSTLTALVATQSFTTEKLIKMTVINLYALRHVIGNSNEQLTVDELKVRDLILDLLAGSLSAFLVPVHTLKTDESLLSYYALPAIKLLLYWLKNEPFFLNEHIFTNKLQIWPSLCKLLNNVQQYLKDFDYEKYAKIPLPEDRDLQGFLPLNESFKDFDFNMVECIEEDTKKFIRVKRLLNIGSWLTNFAVNNTKLIISKLKDDVIIFEPACIQPDPTEDLLEEIKSFSVTETNDFIKIKNGEKRGGILKPQGSLEKSREEREHNLLNKIESKNVVNISEVPATSVIFNSSKPESAKLKRVKQNVALQSIFKKMEENKQVKFNMETKESDKEEKKTIKVEQNMQQQKTVISPGHNQSQFRTQTFNQNHPALSVMQNDDFLRNSFQNKSKIVEKPAYTKNEFSTPNMLPQYSMNNSQVFNMNQKPVNFTPNVTNTQNTFNNIPAINQMPFQNIPFTPSNSFNTWKHDENSSISSGNWWPPPANMPPPTIQQQNKSYQQPTENYYQYPFMNRGNTDFNKPQSDVYNSPWSNAQRTPLPNQGMINYDNSTSQNLSMRQAMLKETNNLPNLGGVNRNTNMPLDKFMHMSSNVQGYSLFNTNSWAPPNLPGQLRSTSTIQDVPVSNVRQQSLFTNQGPQSLAQLVEQQNQQKNDS